jgi:lactoylglutathione lyase
MISKISTVGIYVDSQEKAKEFWVNKVGFEVKAEYAMGPRATWLEVGPKGAETALVVYPKSMMKNWKELKPSIVFVCEDIATVYQELSGKGVEFPMDPKEMQFGIFAQFSDEDGNTYGLRQSK